MFNRVRSTLMVLLLSGSTLSVAATTPSTDGSAGPRPLPVLGWIENAYLVDPGYPLQAKLDTGATTSSLDARIIKRFSQDGKRWVRFAVRNPASGEETVLVRERQRTIGIVQHVGDTEIRPTVNVDICIAGTQHTIEVSLVDRENFQYPLLLGRAALQHIAVVHPGTRFLGKGLCPDDKPAYNTHPGHDDTADEQDDPSDIVDDLEGSGENERIDADHKERH